MSSIFMKNLTPYKKWFSCWKNASICYYT